MTGGNEVREWGGPYVPGSECLSAAATLNYVDITWRACVKTAPASTTGALQLRTRPWREMRSSFCV